MRSPHLPKAALALACAFAAVAQAQPADMPHPRLGLWRTTLSGVGAEGGTMTMSMCIDPAMQHAFSPYNPGVLARRAQVESECSKREAHRVADGWAFESVCMRNGHQVTTSGKITGDFQSHYRVEVVSRGEGPERHIVSDATYLGSCPAGGGQTMTLPDGRTITIPPH